MKFIHTQSLSSRQKTNNLFLAVFFSVLLILTLFIDPREVSLLSCPFKSTTGYNCPTCGMSRSFYAFAHFNLSDAFDYHLFGPLLYLAIVVLLIKSATEIVLNKKFIVTLPAKILRIFFIIIATGWLIFWISNFY